MARTRSSSVNGRDVVASDAIRENILDVATAEFSDRGFAGARIDMIAAKTLTSKRMIYYHFGGKDGLYRAVLIRAYAGIRNAETLASLRALTPLHAMESLVGLTLDYHADHPEFVRLVMDENMRSASMIDTAAMPERSRSVVDTLSAILHRGCDEGIFRADIDPIELHLLISALAFYPVSNRATFTSNFEYDLSEPIARAKHRAAAIEMILRYCRL